MDTKKQTDFDLFELAGRTAIVTGAGSGLGLRHTTTLLHRGVRVAAVDRCVSDLSKLLDTVGPEMILPIQLDVTEANAVKAAVDQTVNWAGAVHCLVNNAGITVAKPPEEETPSEFRSVIDVNVVGTYNFCHFVGREMIRQGSGAIVNIASINGLVASEGEAGYCASKGAVISLTRELAAQWAKKGIRVNALAPGYFFSGMTKMIFESPAGVATMARAPMGRPGAVDELDGPLIFLLSDAASYITGHTLTVDGGWTII